MLMNDQELLEAERLTLSDDEIIQLAIQHEYGGEAGGYEPRLHYFQDSDIVSFARTLLAQVQPRVAELESVEAEGTTASWMYCSSCGDYYPGNSYDAGFLAAAGHCENCDAGMVVADPVHALIAVHSEHLKANEYAYFELACTRQTGWMAWICTYPQETHPDRKVLAKGQGETPQGACNAALSDYVARTTQQSQENKDA